jgi:hypothetical protein
MQKHSKIVHLSVLLLLVGGVKSHNRQQLVMHYSDTQLYLIRIAGT